MLDVFDIRASLVPRWLQRPFLFAECANFPTYRPDQDNRPLQAIMKKLTHLDRPVQRCKLKFVQYSSINQLKQIINRNLYTYFFSAIRRIKNRAESFPIFDQFAGDQGQFDDGYLNTW